MSPLKNPPNVPEASDKTSQDSLLAFGFFKRAKSMRLSSGAFSSHPQMTILPPNEGNRNIISLQISPTNPYDVHIQRTQALFAWEIPKS